MTAVENRLPLIVIVCDDGMYGTVGCTRSGPIPAVFPAPISTPLRGACAGLRRLWRHVERTEDFSRAFDEAVQADCGQSSSFDRPEALTPVSS